MTDCFSDMIECNWSDRADFFHARVQLPQVEFILIIKLFFCACRNAGAPDGVVFDDELFFRHD